MDIDFIQALENHDIATIKKIPKGDLHNHAARGGNMTTIEEWAGVKIKRLLCEGGKFNDLNEMQAWYENNVKCHCHGIEGYEIRIKAAFEQAKNDGISRLVLTFGLDEVAPYGSIDKFIHLIDGLHKRIAPDINFIPEVALTYLPETNSSDHNIESVYHRCEEYFSYGFFKSIDINGIEMTQSAIRFQPIYRLAKAHGMKLRAHAGEFGNAESVKEIAITLELDEIQHGISAAKCKRTMRWLADNKIQLNICPASNILLSRAKDYKTHQIRILFDEGIKVTINTDDMLIFDVSVSEMFMHFYNDKVFTAKELDIIRKFSFS